MVKKLLIGLLLVLVIASTLLASCTSSTSSSTTSIQQNTTSAQTSTKPQPVSTSAVTTTSSPATQSNWWDKFGVPQYGGVLNNWVPFVGGGSFDPDAGFIGAGSPGGNIQYEALTTLDWVLDRNTWAYNTGFTPVEYMKGALAESWDQTDPSTVILHIRQGVHWQNMPPVNGREFTAQDVKYSFDRALATGSGFTQPNPSIAGSYTNIASVTDTGKYTVQIKMKQPGVIGLYQLLVGGFGGMGFVPPEWDKQADPNDWKTAVGTGAWMITDFQVNTSVTYAKNPNYWDYDARFPKNKLPYIDTVKNLAIADLSTVLAAMRTGKIDMIVGPMGGPDWQQAKTLLQSNPEIQQTMMPNSAAVLAFRCDRKPFTDINVRKALQMAINLPEIAKSYYGGLVSGDPVGLNSPLLKGWATPFTQWPAQLQQEYTYNPTKAKQLLADAGYPNGFDTNVVAASNQDPQLLIIVKAELADIGVNLTINSMDPPTEQAFVAGGKQDQMAWDNGAIGSVGPVNNALSMRLTGYMRNFTFNNDPVYDNMVTQINAALTSADMKKGVIAADIYSLQQHWSINFCTTVVPELYQPWVKGYSGEFSCNYFNGLFIDQSLKK